MYDRQELDFGFVILSPEHNIGSVSVTARSIKNHFHNAPITCVVGKDTTTAEIKELKKVCLNVRRGENTITSLINAGMKHGHKTWNMLVMEGVWVKRGIIYRYTPFIENNKDILYPIICDYDREGKPIKIYKDFETCTLNGVLIHHETFKEVGNMLPYGELQKSKFVWGISAMELGCKFKGIIGVKLC